MTGSEYAALRKKFIESAAWFILQSAMVQRHPEQRDTVIDKAITRLGIELREEVEAQLTGTKST